MIMKKFLKSKIGKCFLYTLLCVVVYVGIWAMIGWLLYDFDYLTNIPTRVGNLTQILFSGWICLRIITYINIQIDFW